MAVPQYFFVIRWEEYDDPFGTSFPSDADARDYAHPSFENSKRSETLTSLV